MNVSRKDKKDDDDQIGAMYMNLERTAVVQEARVFNQSPLNPKKCTQILTKILGDVLTRNEATDTFFAMTKLFQSNNVTLRRMVYLVIKELSAIADDVIIVTSSLTKDMTGPEMGFRGPAIRALCKITDTTMIQSIERYLKQAVVDKNPAISSAVLTSTYHLMSTCPEIVKKWANEVQEAASSTKPMVQYHAIGLLYLLRCQDRLAVTKLIQKFTRSSVRSAYAQCLLIRIVAKQIDEDGLENTRDIFEFLESSLRSKSEVVIYEAARAIINLNGVSVKELAPAISVLQLFCTSYKPVMRYAAVRTLSQVANRHPAAVMACDVDLETLIADSNRSIATLAITTLLKTGNENSVERLLKHIFTFMNEISDEFKLTVLESIRCLAVKFPRKYTVLLNFLSSLLRENAGYTFKKAVVLAFESIIKDIPDAKNLGLLLLCEFIEDCEHVKLTERILHLIGQEGPYLKRPRQFTRYIYNRVMLESAPVKCTATTALARFGAYNDELLPSILILLQRIMLDEDDEVRDRAAFYYFILNSGDKALKNAYILTEPMQQSPAGLERALMNYVHDISAQAKDKFMLSTVPVAAPQVNGSLMADEKPTNTFFESSEKKQAEEIKPLVTKEPKGTPGGDFAEKFSKIPQLKSLGPIFKSSAPVELTESETEYVVTCIKHTMQNHIVLQFNCINTMDNQILQNAMVDLEGELDEFEVEDIIPCNKLEYNKLGVTYSIIRLPEDNSIYSCTFDAKLQFNVIEKGCEFDDAGFSDEYALEPIAISLSDHIQRVLKANFGIAWNDLPEDEEVEDTFMFERFKTIKETIRQMIDHLNMQPCDRSDQLPDETKSSHQLLLSGVYRTGVEVLVRCKIVRLPKGEGVNMQMIIRSPDQAISMMIMDSLV